MTNHEPTPALWPTAHQAFLAGQSPAIPGQAGKKAQIIATLAVHEYVLGLSTGAICLCGYVPPRRPESMWSQRDWHRDHLGDVLSNPPAPTSEQP